MRLTRQCLFLVMLLLWSRPALSATETPRGAGFDETLSGDAVLAVALDAAHVSPIGLPLSVRLVVNRGDIERQPGEYDFAALDARVALYGRVGGVRTYIDLRTPIPAPAALEAWGGFVRSVSGDLPGGGYTQDSLILQALGTRNGGESVPADF